ncbi:unnamed protein product [Ectocarpus sp. 13 AM-2016]
MPQHDVDTPAPLFSGRWGFGLARTCIDVGRMAAGVGWMLDSGKLLLGLPVATSFPVAWDLMYELVYTQVFSIHRSGPTSVQHDKLLHSSTDGQRQGYHHDEPRLL